MGKQLIHARRSVEDLIEFAKGGACAGWLFDVVVLCGHDDVKALSHRILMAMMHAFDIDEDWNTGGFIPREAIVGEKEEVSWQQSLRIAIETSDAFAGLVVADPSGFHILKGTTEEEFKSVSRIIWEKYDCLSSQPTKLPVTPPWLEEKAHAVEFITQERIDLVSVGVGKECARQLTFEELAEFGVRYFLVSAFSFCMFRWKGRDRIIEYLQRAYGVEPLTVILRGLLDSIASQIFLFDLEGRLSEQLAKDIDSVVGLNDIFGKDGGRFLALPSMSDEFRAEMSAMVRSMRGEPEAR